MEEASPTSKEKWGGNLPQPGIPPNKGLPRRNIQSTRIISKPIPAISNATQPSPKVDLFIHIFARDILT